MTRISRSWAIGVVMAGGLLGTGRAAMATTPEPLTVSLLVVDQVGVTPNVLRRAEAEATRIYAVLGVKLVWTGGAEAADYQFGVKIVAIPFAANDVDPGALGVAPCATGVRGILAYAFYGRIQDFTTVHGANLGVILGHVIAHELGHLLLPYNSHSKTGLMSGAWNQQQALLAATGAMAFNAEESRLIRTRLAARPN